MPNIISVRWLQTLTTNLGDRQGFLLSFVLGLIVRSIPEILSYPYPIGFDTIYYAERIKSGIVWHHWTSIFSTWLLDAILIPIHQVTQFDPFALLKLTAPILYALSTCGIYYFSRKELNWDVRKALTASLFCGFQLALLRLSWDLYRNMLGLSILLFTLPLIRSIKTKRGFALFVLLCMFIVFSHVLVSVVLFAVILGVVMNDLMKREKVRVVKVLLAVLPALVIFVVSVSPFPVQFARAQGNVINTEEDPTHPGGLFFLVNYLSVSGPVHDYPSYPDLILKVLSLFSVLYLWWLPLVFIGFFRDRIIDCWTLVLLAGAFNVLVTPFCALDFWNRWMFMLVYPFAFYAVNGIQKLSNSESKSVTPDFSWLKWIKVSRRTMLAIFSLAIAFGLIFVAVPPFFDRFGVFFIPPTHSYLPSTMLYNTVPLRDVTSTVNVMTRLNNNMNDRSSVLVHYAFLRWANLYLDKKHTIVYFEKDVAEALNVALNRGFDPIYFVWWNENFLTWQNEDFGWYGLIVPEYFVSLFSSGRISIYQYNTTFRD